MNTGNPFTVYDVLATTEDLLEAERVGELSLKGFHRPITAFNVLRLKA